MQGSASGVRVSRGLCAALHVVMDRLKSFLNVSMVSRKHKMRYFKELCILLDVTGRLSPFCARFPGGARCC